MVAPPAHMMPKSASTHSNRVFARIATAVLLADAELVQPGGERPGAITDLSPGEPYRAGVVRRGVREGLCVRARRHAGEEHVRN